jgi:hypothetical protein
MFLFACKPDSNANRATKLLRHKAGSVVQQCFPSVSVLTMVSPAIPLFICSNDATRWLGGCQYIISAFTISCILKSKLRFRSHKGTFALMFDNVFFYGAISNISRYHTGIRLQLVLAPCAILRGGRVPTYSFLSFTFKASHVKIRGVWYQIVSFEKCKLYATYVCKLSSLVSILLRQVCIRINCY